MRLSEVHVYSKELTIQGGAYTMAGTELHCVTTTIIKMVADNGIIGWGESCPLGASYQAEHALGVQAAIAQLAPLLIGKPLTQPLMLARHMDSVLNGHHSAKAVFDIAGLDCLGKHLGLPVYELLGGSELRSIPSYYAIGLETPEETARIAKEKINIGFKRLQLKIGRESLYEDIDSIKRVWQAVGQSAQLVADANRGLSVKDTLLLSQQCRDIPIVLEQPCATLSEIKSLKPRLHHPIYLDENTVDLNTVLDAVAHSYCDGFGFKVTRLGGLTAFAKARDICEARHIPVTCDDTFGGDIIAAACVHGAATVKPALFEGTWIAAPYIEESYDPKNSIQIENGQICVPTRAGLGIDPDEDRVGKCIASYA